MMDRDRVIGGLALLKVPLMNEPLAQEILDSAIALLKEQGPIIRCKDCKFYSPNEYRERVDGCDVKPNFAVTPEWYCADAVRK